MSLLFLAPTKDPEPWQKAIAAIDPNVDFRVWPDVGNPDEIRFVLLWNHPPASLQPFKNLKAISSLGAGIDHINNDPDIPAGIPIVRIVDPALVQSMSAYVVTAVLMHFRDFKRYSQQQDGKSWQPLPARSMADFPIGIMGMGELGMDAAKKLYTMGFKIYGWSRSRKSTLILEESFAGENELPSFLGNSRILVCLLPLTTATKGILKTKLINALPDQAYLINVARGAHLVEDDLLIGLDTGKLSGACLDVFAAEPLPATHPFWTHPAITITPHIASITDPSSAARQVVENYWRAVQNQSLMHEVDLSREY